MLLISLGSFVANVSAGFFEALRSKHGGDKMKDKRVFTLLDLTSGYWQVFALRPGLLQGTLPLVVACYLQATCERVNIAISL